MQASKLEIVQRFGSMEKKVSFLSIGSSGFFKLMCLTFNVFLRNIKTAMKSVYLSCSFRESCIRLKCVTVVASRDGDDSTRPQRRRRRSVSRNDGVSLDDVRRRTLLRVESTLCRRREGGSTMLFPRPFRIRSPSSSARSFVASPAARRLQRLLFNVDGDDGRSSPFCRRRAATFG